MEQYVGVYEYGYLFPAKTFAKCWYHSNIAVSIQLFNYKPTVIFDCLRKLTSALLWKLLNMLRPDQRELSKVREGVCTGRRPQQLLLRFRLKLSWKLEQSLSLKIVIVLQVQWGRTPVPLPVFLLEISPAVWWEWQIFSARGHVRPDWGDRRGGHLSGGDHTQDPVAAALQLHWGHQLPGGTQDDRGNQAGGKRWLERRRQWGKITQRLSLRDGHNDLNRRLLQGVPEKTSPWHRARF